MKKIAVYCGSRSGHSSLYQEQAIEMGKVLAKNNIGLIYGGGAIGLMGCIADTVLEHHGHVIGVIPTFLDTVEITHQGLSELFVTNDMPDRKKKMYELADGFIALPGGIGTLEELFEVFTWRQLNLHNKPIGVLNTNGYYNYLIQHIAHMVTEGFLSKKHAQLIIIEDNPKTLLQNMYTLTQ
ncbi:TIGR00730 family Rossman fold protein [Flavobacteriales bacterium]|nr:TIGR00730 family Rossman fold protein [Flavobacteriales bacterium]